MSMLLRDTVLRTLLCEDVAARYAAADAAGFTAGVSREHVAARYRYGAADAAV